MTAAETVPTSMPPGSRSGPRPLSRSVATDVALVAAFAGIVAVCSYAGAIPVGAIGVPITLQTFAVLLAGCVLGPVRGFLAVSLYLLLGVVGLPVFAGHTSGLAAMSSPAAGYLWSFPLSALVAGLLVKYALGNRGMTHSLLVFACSLAGTALVIHPLGILGLHLWAHLSFRDAASIDSPFWVGDILKAAVVALVASQVHRAFPQLLRGRR